MNNSLPTYKKWQKEIVKASYFLALIIFAIELVYFAGYYYGDRITKGIVNYALIYLAIPTFINYFCIIACDIIIRKSKISDGAKSYVSICSLFIPTGIIMCIHYVFMQLIWIMAVPLFVTTVFGNKKMTRIFFYASFIFFIISILESYFDPRFTNLQILFDYSLGLGLLIGTYILTKVLVNYQKARFDDMMKAYIEQKELVERLKLDSLTGLINNGSIKEFMDTCIKNNEKMCFSMIDIDDFKAVNDTYGHMIGDNVLKQLAKIIKSKTGKSIIGSRYGGEEFGILFLDMSVMDAKLIVEEILEEFSAYNFGFYVTFSAGMSSFKANMKNVESLINSADNALYDAKEQGKNRIIIGY